MIPAITHTVDFLNTALQWCAIGAWTCLSIALGAMAVGITKRGKS